MITIRAAVAAMWALAMTGCASSAGSQVRADVSVVRQERTSDRLYERARAFAEIGDLVRAEQYYSAAIDSGYDDRIARPELIRVCVQAQRYRVAVEYARDGIARRPDDVRLRYLLGTLHAALGDPLSAREELTRVLGVRPHDPEVHYALAKILTEAHLLQSEADTHYRAYLHLAPEGPHATEARNSLLQAVP